MLVRNFPPSLTNV